MSFAVAGVLLLLLGLLTLVSTWIASIRRRGNFFRASSRTTSTSSNRKSSPSWSKPRQSRSRAALSMAVLTQLTMAAIAMICWLCRLQRSAVEHLRNPAGHDQPDPGHHCLQSLSAFRIFLPTKGEWLVHWTLVLKVLIYLVLPVTIVLGFMKSVASLTKQNTNEQPELRPRRWMRLIEAGQEEGIIQEGDRDLIQSVVEFSGKTVREAMKPRPAMFAVPIDDDGRMFHRDAAREALLARAGV